MLSIFKIVGPYPVLQTFSQVLPKLLAFVGSAVIQVSVSLPVQAQPAEVFQPHIAEISRSTPAGLAMRLPSQILLNSQLDLDPNQLIVRVFSSQTPASLTVSLFTCNSNPYPCLVGSFSVERKNSQNAMRELAKHQAKGDRITLKKTITGYLLEGSKQNPSYEFSSVMWEQDGMVYRVTFPLIERQNLLLMAYSMANQVPIRRIVPRPDIFPR